MLLGSILMLIIILIGITIMVLLAYICDRIREIIHMIKEDRWKGRR
jgi:hypothetical protein